MSPPASNGSAASTISPLRQALSDAAAETGLALNDLTVLATQNDPFRVDTPARHRDGEWLATNARELGLGDRRIHLRGLHYMVIGRSKPNGQPYTNTEEDWTWLSEHAAKAARWLRYLPFDQIVDQRNAAPVIITRERLWPRAQLFFGINVEIPDADDFTPEVDVADFRGVQPYRLVLFGEKSSLEDVLQPLAEYYQADLYLPTGEISDTLMYRMASEGAADGRPMVVLCFSDSDPAGWQMPISIGRKLQAFKALGVAAALEFQVHRVALHPDQVGEYGLPSTPMKETERRGDRWKAAWGTEQTEIDALASLQPDLLRRIARDAITKFYDTSLERRVSQARDTWLDDAEEVLQGGLDQDELDRLRADAQVKLDGLRDEIEHLNQAMHVDASSFDFPEIEIPEPVVNEDAQPEPLIDSGWSFTEQCQRLIDSKAYRPRAGRRES